jgi:hypothetical protein
LKRRGFVLAMRARYISAAPLAAQFEWVILSRWGAEGEFLALGWTMLPALPNEPPIHLAPCRTSLARAVGPGEADARARFELLSSLGQTTIAGDFVPAKGYIRLFGQGAELHMVSKGKSLRPDLHPSWQIQATREAWFGEFIEPGNVSDVTPRQSQRKGE